MRPVRIVFCNNPKLYYYPGETVRGLVQVGSKAPFGKIVITVDGWSKVGSSGKKSESLSVLNIEQRIVVDGGSSVCTGPQCWPFTFVIPENVPPSFVGILGEIWYQVKAQIMKASPTEGVLSSALEPIAVKSNLSLNDDMYMSPVRGHVQESVKRFLITNGNITIDLSTDRSSYCQNDLIELSGTISNGSNHAVVTHISLLQEQIFRVEGESQTRFQARPVAPVVCAPVVQIPIRKSEDRQWDRVCVHLLSDYPSFHSELIDVNYSLEIQVKSRWVRPVTVRIPILISTVPILHRTDMFDEIVDGLEYEEVQEPAEQDTELDLHAAPMEEDEESTHHPLPPPIEEEDEDEEDEFPETPYEEDPKSEDDDAGQADEPTAAQN